MAYIFFIPVLFGVWVEEGGVSWLVGDMLISAYKCGIKFSKFIYIEDHISCAELSLLYFSKLLMIGHGCEVSLGIFSLDSSILLHS